ncbi:hypothetical protein QNI23_010230 [Bermanella sp. WJH001]|uniref:hypothetical protein n=1 Tax=Bermanella sp. WJH001 TaxID=3048005 RepID=UPI0024BEAA56|nr:hypothetical protein [Bermanella sp. WJH001]MDJ1537373.1 hypothetical protein [Bermanella sp. WJH001]
MPSPEHYPFFTLVNNQCEAESALAAIECFGNHSEKRHLKPKAHALKVEFLCKKEGLCFAQKVNTLLAEYIANVGELSDQLTIALGKSLHYHLR